MRQVKKFTLFFLVIAGIFGCRPNSEESNVTTTTAEKESFDIIAYYSGSGADIKNYPLDKLDQIIYSFLHLKGNQLAIDNREDSLSLIQITSLKKDFPKLKVLVSLGGWGGCETCSEVFETEANRKAFAQSVVKIIEEYNADGIDLDWEYPAIAGFPDHTHQPEDRQNFTALVEELRAAMGDDYELSFAAGGFDQFLIESVEWDKVMPLFDRVNLMSYDLVNGFSQTTGHHTALYSNAKQQASTDYAVQFLDSIGVPTQKIVIGAAFYARLWENVPDQNSGLYQSGKFLRSISFPQMEGLLNSNDGFLVYWDSISRASYAYSPLLQQFATYDDSNSLEAKVQYVRENNLGGLMFWELRNDKKQDGLLDVIHRHVNK